MAQRYKINGIVQIPAGLLGADIVEIDSPEFEVTQGRQADSTAFIGVTYYYNQGSVQQQAFVEYPIPFADLNPTEAQAITDLITQANIHVEGLPQHAGAVLI